MTQLPSYWHTDTVFVHGGRDTRTSGTQGTPTIPPIHATTTYLHENVELLDAAFSGTTPDGEPAFVYARQGNPNANALEETLAQAESGVGALAFGSGMAAIYTALLAAGATPGAKILASQDMYGPSIGLLQKLFAPNGVTITLCDLCGEQASDSIRAEEPDIVFVETLSNPLVKLVDLDALSSAAHEVGAVCVVDSTFTTPYLVKPIEHGFDLVVHSATKYISGHGDSTAGIAISAKNTLLDQLRAYNTMLGAMLSPFESHLMLRGIRTLALRMERQCDNAMHVAHFLQEHSAVERVYYTGLVDHPQHTLASRLLAHEQYGGLLSFDLKEQTKEAVFRFMNGLQLCLPATTLGDVFSLVSYPAMSSHRNMTGQERQRMGISEGCIRLSVGIENINDILADLDRALSL